jgi:hemolysin III
MEIGERFNTVTHTGGYFLASIGSVYLLWQMAGRDWPGVVSVGIYCSTLMLLYGCSALYHNSSGRLKQILQKFDHYAIYLLIAGTYTPFCALALNQPLGWRLLTGVWLLALLGIAQEVRSKGARWFSVVIYLGMGWAAVLVASPLRLALGGTGFGLVLAGGLFYTIGIVFYVLDARLRHAHGIWHLFVMLGSAAHFAAVAWLVLPAGA